MTADPDIAVVRSALEVHTKYAEAVGISETVQEETEALAALDRLEARLETTEAERDEALREIENFPRDDDMSAPPLATRLRNEANEWDEGETIPPMLLEAAEAIELLAAKVCVQAEGLRWIAAGRTGSYGTPQAFAAAILEDTFAAEETT